MKPLTEVYGPIPVCYYEDIGPLPGERYRPILETAVPDICPYYLVSNMGRLWQASLYATGNRWVLLFLVCT